MKCMIFSEQLVISPFKRHDGPLYCEMDVHSVEKILINKPKSYFEIHLQNSKKIVCGVHQIDVNDWCKYLRVFTAVGECNVQVVTMTKTKGTKVA
eukprot:TRINITY_DN10227_c0_g1_i1.p2 TRINITY_DN10227_c0_g1~~TRINITY_DN10227_c0_g1_i1.p2  ORF type:complete len:95 (+),score=14.81 TRINITY_DN10227_c0_g1_i1:154-438(+)